MSEKQLYTSSRRFDISGRSGHTKWPFPCMEIGDTITIEDQTEHDNATCSYKYSAKKYAMKFTRKTVGGLLIIERIS